MIDDRNLHRIETTGDRQADPSQPEDADGAIPQGRPGQRIGALLLPTPGPKILLGSRQFAHGIEEKAKRRIGDLLGQHVRRIGDDDSVRGAISEIDPVIADAKIREDLELRKLFEQGPIAVEMPTAGETADAVARFGGDRGDSPGVRRAMAIEVALKHFERRRAYRAQHHDVDLGHESPGSDMDCDDRRFAGKRAREFNDFDTKSRESSGYWSPWTRWR